MIIVTGGAGFIGSNLVYELNKLNNKKIIICDLINSKLKENYLKKIRYKQRSKYINWKNISNFFMTK